MPWREYLRCEACEFVWLKPKCRLSSSQEWKHYTRHTNNPNDSGYREFLNRLWQPLKQTLPHGASGLDYGSGPGPTLHLMAQEDGFACDHYDPFFHPDKTVFSRQFDFITCSETAEHFHNPALEFGRLFEMLRQGGILGVMTSFLPEDQLFSEWHYRMDPTHVSFYSRETFSAIKESFGFSEVFFPDNNIVLLKR